MGSAQTGPKSDIQQLIGSYGASAVLKAYLDTHTDVDTTKIYQIIGQQGANRAAEMIFGIRLPRTEVRTPGAVAGPAVTPGLRPQIQTVQPQEPAAQPGARRLPTPAARAHPETGVAPKLSPISGLQPATKKLPSLKKLSSAHDLMDNLIKLSKTYDVPLSLILAIMKKESEYNPLARGSKGEIGLVQLMPKTAQAMGLTVTTQQDDRADPMKSIEGGLKYLAWLRKNYKPKTVDALLGGYNAGPSRLKDDAYKKIKSTTKYIQTVKAFEKELKGDPTVVASDIITLWGNIEAQQTAKVR